MKILAELQPQKCDFEFLSWRYISENVLGSSHVVAYKLQNFNRQRTFVLSSIAIVPEIGH